MKRWTSRTAVVRVVPGDRAHTARCSNGSGACRAGRMVRVDVAARAVFQFQRLWSAAFQIQRFWNAAATARCSRGSGSVGEDVTKRFPRGKWNSAINKKTGNGPRCSQGVVLRRLVSKIF